MHAYTHGIQSTPDWKKLICNVDHLIRGALSLVRGRHGARNYGSWGDHSLIIIDGARGTGIEGRRIWASLAKTGYCYSNHNSS